MPSIAETPEGIKTWVNKHGIRIVRLHYAADAEKNAGEKVWNERQQKYLSPWADREERGMTDPARYRQEYEIDFQATAGQLVYQLHDKATLCKSFPIPLDWTRITSCDPHPRVPHAWLWCAVSPDGDRWYYREFWNSKIYGKAGSQPDDDNRPTIRETVETVIYFESGRDDVLLFPRKNSEPYRTKGNSENPKKERIYKRVIDYSARAMGQGTIDDPEMPNFQQRYEIIGGELGGDMRFEDAKKDLGVGIELVNEGLRPREILNLKTDTIVKQSRIHIFADQCPELIWELKNNRWKPLSPTQADTHDPSGKVIEKRKHMTDNLRYIEMAAPEYIPPSSAVDTWSPINDGVNF